jgi:hypothetical protein
MRERKFVWTWWAGMVQDSFGPGSMFQVARLGVLRVPARRLASGETRMVCRRRERIAAAAAGWLRVAWACLCSISEQRGGYR